MASKQKFFDKKRLPDSTAKPEYPYNHVENTPSGHRFEVDDTPGHERLLRAHKSGTYEEVSSDGKKVDHVVGNRHTYTKGSAVVTVDGATDVTTKGLKTTVNGGSLVEVKGKCDLVVYGDVKIVCMGGNINLVGKNIHLSATDNINLDANDIKINAKNSLLNKAGGTATTAAGKSSTEASGTVEILAKGDIITKGATTKIQRGGKIAPPTTFR